MYFFYAVPMAPFLAVLLALICHNIVDEGRHRSEERQTLGLLAVCCYVALVLTNFAWLYPILTGVPISPATWNMEIWLPSWS
jgi:dolichyl-phosphate-mannose--protein O-mannosyl transferase